MKLNPWAALRDARYALPRTIESHVRGPDAADAARIILGLALIAGCMFVYLTPTSGNF